VALNNETPSSAEALDEVIVTGTRQTGITAADSPEPIQILRAESLKAAAGKPDLLQTLAELVPSLTAQTSGNDLGNNTLQVKLRGLSANHVLVLVNGKRRHTTASFAADPGPFSGSAGADLSFIPVSAIDHIEVLTDGAAAQYGSDAIAGVINIILKKNSSGGSVDATYGGYYDGGGLTSDVSANAGFEPVSGGYLNLTAEVRNHGHSDRGDIDPRLTNPSTIYPADGGTFPDTNVPYAPGYPYLNQIEGDAETHMKILSFNSGFDVGADSEFYAFGTYGHKSAQSLQNYRLPDLSSYTAPSGAVTYQYPFGFSPQEAIGETDYGLTVGLKGSLVGWRWDVSSTYGYDHIDVNTIDSTNPYLYGSTGSSPTDFYDGLFKTTQWTSNVDFDRDFDVGLAGPVNVAFGGE
jgi:iron complex outermembrane recepter protein